LLKRPSLDALVFLPAAQKDKVKGQTSRGEPSIQVGSSRVRVFPSSKGRG